MLQALSNLVTLPVPYAAACPGCSPEALWTLAGARVMVGVALLSIALALTLFAARWRERAYRRLFLVAAMFLYACALTQFVELIDLWQPITAVIAAIKATAAVAGLATAGALRVLLPRVLALPSREELERSRQELMREGQAREGVEQELGRREEQYRQLSESLERRVAARTRQLEDTNAALQREIAEHRRTELQLHGVNQKLANSLDALEARTAQLEQINRMSGLLQSIPSAAESCEVVARFAQRLFPSASGSVLLLDEPRRIVEAQATWGELPADDLVFPSDECWAIRRGALHPGIDEHSGLRCAHLRGYAGPYVCVPMIANGETLGLLHLRGGDERLDSHARAILGTIAERSALALANLREHQHLVVQSVRDSLTGLYNRRFLDSAMQLEERRARRARHPFAVLMLDVDHFKSFNDRYGHDAGDSVLRDVGRILQSQTRGGDLACRYGGEEFVVIMPGAALEAGLERAAKLRETIAATRFIHQARALAAVSASLGVAAFPTHGDNWTKVLREADQALYRAKRAGRNRVQAAGAET